MFTLHNGDCLTVMKSMQSKSVDCIITDPPYGTRTDQRDEWMVGEFSNIMPLALPEIHRIGKGNAAIYFFTSWKWMADWVLRCSPYYGGKSLSSFRQAIYFQEIGFTVHDTMIWNKGCFTSPQSNRYPDVFEYMFVLSKGSPKTYNLLTDRKNVSSGKFRATKRTAEGTIKEMYKSATHKEHRSMGVRFNVWEMPPEQSNINRLHPAQFAERLAQDHILSWSNENDVVLDCFAGSGTTLKMAKMLSRQYIGIEISHEYVTLAEKRLLATPVPLFGQGRGLTLPAPDGGDSAPSQALSTLSKILTT